MNTYIKQWRSFLKEYKAPEKMYHGGPKKFASFESARSNYRGLTYFTSNLNFAKSFAGGRGLEKGYIYTVQLPGNLKVFDVTEEDNLEKLRPVIQDLVSQGYKDPITGMNFNIPRKSLTIGTQTIENASEDEVVEYFMWRLKNKSWRMLEGEKVLNFIESLGYDAIVVTEGSTENVGIFPKHTNNIKIISVDEIDVDPD